MIQIAEMLAWALLAALATRVSWHRAEAVMGLSLIVCSLITSGAYFGSALPSRLVLEICQALCVTFTARVAFATTGSIAAALVVALALADVALAGAISLALAQGNLSLKAANWWLGWGANSIFLAQCLCVGAPGVRDVVDRRLSARDPRRALDQARAGAHARLDPGAPK